MLSEHFDRREFACNCGCGFDTVDAELLTLLEKIRVYFGSPVRINSGCRCPDWNKKQGGSPKSQHLTGKAADIVVSGVSPADVADYAEKINAGGIGRYSTFTHIDSRTHKARWGSDATIQ